MKTKTVLFCLLLSAAFGTAAKDIPRKDLSSKDAFTQGFPRQVVFRGEYTDTLFKRKLDNYTESTANSVAIIHKFTPYDEWDKIKLDQVSEMITRYIRKNPRQTVLLHWDAFEHCNHIPGSSDRYFPGHWTSYPGCLTTAAITPSDRTIAVEDARIFDAREKNKAKGRHKYKNPTLLLVELDKDGNRLWEKYEFVEIDSVEVANNTIRVKRGTALSTPRSFKEGVYIAPMSTRLSAPWLFDYNFSTDCPRDKNGKQAKDILLDEFKDLFDPKKGPLRHLDGIGFDVMLWAPRDRFVDSDNDGRSDGAVKNGENLWMKGSVEFLKALREHFGDDFIIIDDGYSTRLASFYGTEDSRATGLLNGIESEGTVNNWDPFRGISKTLNVFSYWNENTSADHKLSFLAQKINSPIDAPKAEQYIRFGIGVSTVLGISSSRITTRPPEDEIICGVRRTPFWLGMPTDKMRNLALESENILSGRLPRVTGENCTVTPTATGWIVKGNARDKNTPCILHFESRSFAREGDLTFCFEIKGPGMAGYPQDNFPRVISASAQGLPQYEKTPREDSMYNTMWGLFGPDKFSPVSFYYRRAAGRPIELTLKAEEQGEFEIRNFKAYNAPAVLVREFEKGIVLVNPSLEDHTFDLEKLSPGKTYRRIEGRDKAYPNTGEKVSGRVTLGPVESLFLVRE